MSMATVTLIIIGIVVMLYLGIMIIVNHNMSKHDKFIRSMVSIPEILNEYGIEGRYEEKGTLDRNKLTIERVISRDSVSLDISGKDLLTGRYKQMEFESATIYISLNYGTEFPPELLYRGRITVMYPKSGPAMTHLLIQKQLPKKSGMTKKFGTEMAITNRLIGFIHGKKKIEVDPEWDKKWITYSDNSEKTAKMFGYGTKYRELLMPSQLDFILWTDRSIVFGSKNDIVFEDGNGKDVRQNVRDSIGEILQDFDAIVLYCT